MSESRITRMTQMKGGLGWQVGRRCVAETNVVSKAEGAGLGSAGGVKVAGGARDKAGERGCGVIRAIL